jgi:hypothetical protein
MSKTISELEKLVERAEYEREAAGRATDNAWTDEMTLSAIKLRKLRAMLTAARQASGDGQ